MVIFLKECCVLMIELLTKLKDNGLITLEEYEKHTEGKKQFLLHIYDSSV